jgi:O-antigen/teichoic acid export membrane protein
MLARHTFIYFLSHGVPGLVSFLAVSIYSHMMTPAEYGLYALVLVASGFINSVLFQWLRLSLLRFLPGIKDEQSRLKAMSTVLFGFLLLVAGSGLLSLIGYLAIGAGRGIGVYWLLATVVGWSQAWLEINLTFLRSRLSPVVYGLLSFSKAVLSLGAGVALVALHFGAYGLLAGMALGMLIPLIVPSIRYWSKPFVHMKVDWTLVKSMLAYGLPLTLTFALGAVIHYTDRVVISIYMGAGNTGIYSLAYDFSDMTITTIMMIVNLSAFPLVMKAYERHGTEAAKVQMNSNFVLLTALSLPTAAGIICLAPNISQVVFGDAYETAAAAIIPIITVAAWIRGMKSYYLDIAFQFGKKTLMQIIPVVAAALINVAFNFIWVPVWGINGAIAATLLAYLVSSSISWYIGRKLFPIPIPLKELGKAAAATLLMVIALLPLRDGAGIVFLLVQIAAGVFVYALGVILFNVGNARELIRGRVGRFLKNKRKASEAGTN